MYRPGQGGRRGKPARLMQRSASGGEIPDHMASSAGFSTQCAALVAASPVLCAAVPAAARAPVILDFGDSLTAGYGLMPEQAFPARLEAWLREHGIAAQVVNAGVSGDTTAGGLARLDWALADKPDLVILALGANDALRGIDPVTVRDNLDKMVQKIEATGAKVLLSGCSRRRTGEQPMIATSTGYFPIWRTPGRRRSIRFFWKVLR